MSVFVDRKTAALEKIAEQLRRIADALEGLTYLEEKKGDSL